MMESLLEEAEYLNAGCGTVRYDNCINMDIVKNAYVDADIVGSVLSIPFPAERFKGVIFSHVLEHVSRNEHKLALLEIRRVLKQDGTLYVEVPDFELALQYYLSNKRGRKDYWYQCIYGRNEYNSDQHKSGLSEQYLTDLLFETGFSNLRWIDIDKEEAILAVMVKRAGLPEV